MYAHSAHRSVHGLQRRHLRGILSLPRHITSFHPEKDLFPMSGVLRGLPSAAYPNVRLNENPCAALLIEKISHFWIGNCQVAKILLKMVSRGGFFPNYKQVLHANLHFIKLLYNSYIYWQVGLNQCILSMGFEKLDFKIDPSNYISGNCRGTFPASDQKMELFQRY